jgi:hypothetical protein
MNARNIFGLAIRLLGLVFLYQGLTSLPMSLGQSLHALMRIPASIKDGSIISWPFLGLWPFVVACWLLYGAPPLMRIAFAKSSHETADDV